MGFTALKIFKMYKYPYTEMMRYINPQRNTFWRFLLVPQVSTWFFINLYSEAYLS